MAQSGGDLLGIGTIFGSIIDGIFGIGTQEREFDQQNALTDKQNEWNSAQSQMQRAKEAGINPLTAAAGISGGGTNAAAPAGGAASPMNMAGAMSDALRFPSETEKNHAAAEKDLSEARNLDRRTDSEILLNASAAAKNFTASGIPEIQAAELGLAFAKNGLQGLTNAFNADRQCRMFDLQMNKIDVEINETNQRFADLEAQTRLHGSLAELTAIQKEHENVLKDIDSRRLDFVNKYESYFADNDTLAQFSLFRQYGFDSPEYKAYMQFVQDKVYNQSMGQYQADIDTAWERFKNQAEGTDFGKLIHGKDIAKLENFKTMFEVMAQLYYGSGSTETALLSKIIGFTSTMFELDVKDVKRMFKDAVNP